MNIIKNYFLQEQGGVASEYSIVVALILVFAVGAINLGGTHFIDRFYNHSQTH